MLKSYLGPNTRSTVCWFVLQINSDKAVFKRLGYLAATFLNEKDSCSSCRARLRQETPGSIPSCPPKDWLPRGEFGCQQFFQRTSSDRTTEILEFAREVGLDPNVVEKDYVLGWMTQGIGQHPRTRDTWVFKGGTV